VKYLLLLSLVLLAGCGTTNSRGKVDYTRLTVTDPSGDLIAEWIAEGKVKKTDLGYDIKAVERHSSRPDFQALIYPGSSANFKVEPGMPPAFLAAGYNDRPDIAEGLANLYLKYKAAKIPAELHIFANAGHGFGYRADAKPSAAARWPERFTDWLTDSGLCK